MFTEGYVVIHIIQVNQRIYSLKDCCAHKVRGLWHESPKSIDSCQAPWLWHSVFITDITRLFPKKKQDMQFTYNTTLKRVRLTIVSSESDNYYVFWVCVCSLRYPGYSAHAPYCHLCPVRLYHIFPNWRFSIPLCQYNNLLFIVLRTQHSGAKLSYVTINIATCFNSLGSSSGL